MMGVLSKIIENFFSENTEELNWWKNLDKDLKRILRYNLYHQDKYNFRNMSYINHSLHSKTELKDILELKILTAPLSYVSNVHFLERLVCLTKLNLSGNKISNIQPLKKIIDLEYLDISSNLVSDLKPLQRLIILKHLRLNNNQIANVQHLQNLNNLEILNLNGNHISDIKPIERLINLKELQLFDNPLKIEDIESLEKKLPNCKIHY